jgi:adenosylcobinamide kinase/adenosylcobinamide-phosphate guanylyltransferase
MSMVLLTGAARSGKSAAAERLAASRGGPVMVAAAGWDGDVEMERRVAAHRSLRPAGWTTVPVTADPGWIDTVPPGAVLVLDCLATLVSNACVEAVGEAEFATAEAEAAVTRDVDALVAALVARDGDCVIVSNETGWGVVPAYPVARVFRDALGRANRALTAAADAAYLVIDGRFLDLRALPETVGWPA